MQTGPPRLAICVASAITGRLSAYTYVFRCPEQSDSVSTRPSRRDHFMPGATFEAAVALHDFDRSLRRILLDGLQTIEVGLRVRIGYQVGKTDPFGHINRASLDPKACAKKNQSSGGEDLEAFERWRNTYNRNVQDAKPEAFVQHFFTKYDGNMPIWVATELMTFGSLLWLYELLSSKDAKRIADDLGIKDRSLLHRYLKALNVLRNHCAHNARVWNRSTVYPPKKPPLDLTPKTLHHLRKCDPDRLYFLAALIAHFVVTIDDKCDWPRQFITVIKKFPAALDITTHNAMGFPADWHTLPLWQHSPEK